MKRALLLGCCFLACSPHRQTPAPPPVPVVAIAPAPTTPPQPPEPETSFEGTEKLAESLAAEDRGWELLSANDPDGAINRFVDACRLRKNCGQALAGLGLAYKARGQASFAKRYFERAITDLETLTGQKVRVLQVTRDQVGYPHSSGSRWFFANSSSVQVYHGGTLRQLASYEVPAWAGAPRGRNWHSMCIGPCGDIELSPDGKRLVSIRPSQSVSIVELDGTKPVENISSAGGADPVSVSWSPDGSMIAASLESGIGIFDAKTHALLRTIQSPSPAKFLDDKALATSKGVFDVATGKAIRTLTLAGNEAVKRLSVAGRFALARDAKYHDGKPRLLDLDGKRPPRIIPDEKPFRVELNPEGTIVAGAGRVSTGYGFDVATGTLKPFQFEGAVEDIRVHGKLIAVWGSGPLARLWDATTGMLVRELSIPDPQARGYLDAGGFSSDGKRFYAYGSEPYVRYVWDVSTGALLGKRDESALLEPIDASKMRKTPQVGAITFENGRFVMNGKPILSVDDKKQGYFITEAEGGKLTVLRSYAMLRAGSMVVDDKLQLFGEDRVRAEEQLACAIGPYRLPYAVCAHVHVHQE